MKTYFFAFLLMGMIDTSQALSVSSCGFSCAVGKMQKVKSILTSTEADQKRCSRKCCMTKRCVAFNYDTTSKLCSLSAWSFAQAFPVASAKTVTTCQKAAGDEPERKFYDSVDLLAEDEYKPKEEEYSDSAEDAWAEDD